MGRPRGGWAKQNRKMCPRCAGGMQRDDESWFCEFCGHFIPMDDMTTETPLVSTDLDMEDEQLLKDITKKTEWSGS